MTRLTTGIVVVSSNWDRMEDCMRALEEQDNQDFMLVLLDYGEKQCLREKSNHSLLARGLRLAVLDARNTSVTKAWNMGIDYISRTDQCNPPHFAAFLDDDSRPARDWLTQMTQAAQSADEKTGMFASVVLAKCASKLRSAGHALLPWGRPDRGHKRCQAEGPPIGAPLCPCEAGALFRWKAIEDILRQKEGFVDDELIVHYWSCLDVGLKAQALGWTCALVPKARVIDVGFDATVQRIRSSDQISSEQEGRLVVSMKYLPDEMLLEALIEQLGKSTTKELHNNGIEGVVKCFESLAQKKGKLLIRRKHWQKVAAERGIDLRVVFKTGEWHR